MPLWVLGLLVIGACASYHVVLVADKQENPVIRQMGYLVGMIGIAAIGFSALMKVYYAFDAISRI